MLLVENRWLLDAFRRGEASALSRVYTEYAPVVASFLSRGFAFRSKGRSLQFRGYVQPFEIDDALQSTFLRAFAHSAREAYDGVTPYRRYLLTIARNLVIGEHRRREVPLSQIETGPGEETEIPADPTLDETPDQETALLAAELERLCQAFIRSLKGIDRRYFVARFQRHQIRAAAASSAGLSIMQARSLERRLRQSLLAFLQGHGYLDTRQDHPPQQIRPLPQTGTT